MYQVVFSIYIICVIALIAVILIQKPSSNSLANLSSSSSKHRSESNFITKSTGILGSIFMMIALGLSIMMKPQEISIASVGKSESIRIANVDEVSKQIKK
jgi:protein translocase SecG subunit